MLVGVFLLVASPGFALARRDGGDDKTDSAPAQAVPVVEDEAAGQRDSGQKVIAWPVVAAAGVIVEAGDESNPPSTSDLQVLTEVIEKLAGDQAAGVDKQKLIEAAIQGMLKRVDENAAYLSRDDVEGFNRVMSGMVGVGIVLNMIDDKLK
jgi:hypothetical protein